MNERKKETNGSRLEQIRKGRRKAPDRVLVMGTEGVGKSTFAAGAPAPIFIAAEDGIAHLDVASFPEPSSFLDLVGDLTALLEEEHAFRTVVIDTVDWVEPLVQASVCKREGWLNSEGRPDIEAPGYGKGYTAAIVEWRRLLAGLDLLRERRGMEIVLLGHSQITTHDPPDGDPFARYELAMHKRAGALLKQWCDSVLFATHEDRISKKDRKAYSTGRRILHTERSAAFDAKSRHDLPPILPLSWEDYAEARDGEPDVADLQDQCFETIQRIRVVGGSEREVESMVTYVEKTEDPRDLIVLRERLTDRLDDLETELKTKKEED